jgi:4-amino-4-deoxychorismate lyase
MEWRDSGIADGILLDMDGHVIECTSANIFARFGDTLITPSLDFCGVAGISRQRILDFAYTLQLKTKIETFDLKKLLSADEIVICNSLYGAWQVRSVQDKTWQKQALATNIRNALAT